MVDIEQRPVNSGALSPSQLRQSLQELRSQLEQGFSPETARFGESGRTLSAGQCAAVALIVREILGGQLVSAVVEGESHWFNRLVSGEEEVDVDLTADQFHESLTVRVAKAGQLYPGTRPRADAEVAVETKHRSELLKVRSGLDFKSPGSK